MVGGLPLWGYGLLLSALLALQLAHSYPHISNKAVEVQLTRDAEHRAKSTEDAGDTARNQLLSEATAVFIEDAKYSIREWRTFISDALKELNGLSAKSATLQANITEMSRVLQLINNIDLDAKEPLVEEIFDAVERVNEMGDTFESMPESKDPKSDVYVLERAFEKAGSDAVEQKMNDMTIFSMKLFEDTLERFSKQLNSKQRIKETKLLEWYERFKRTKEMDEKLKMLEEFWTYF